MGRVSFLMAEWRFVTCRVLFEIIMLANGKVYPSQVNRLVFPSVPGVFQETV